MEYWQREHLRKNMPELVKFTTCNTIFLTRLQAFDLLHETEVEILVVTRDSKGATEQALKLYEILQKKLGSFDLLKNALRETLQTGALEILNQYKSKLIRYGAIEYDTTFLLGEGSMSTKVYKGSFNGRPAAVKVLPQSLIPEEKAMHEIDLLIQLDVHKNIIRYFGKEVTNEFVLIALELCTTNLFDFITKSRKSYSEWNVLELLKQSTEAIAYLHENGIVHRDLKPENILLQALGKEINGVLVKVSDFGIARKIPDGSSYLKLSTSGHGTEDWAAPEVIKYLEEDEEDREKLKMTCQMDVFSLGCIFFFVVSGGRHPFGKNRAKRRSNIRKGRAVDLSKEIVSEIISDVERFVELVQKMVALEVTLRPTAKEILTIIMLTNKEEKSDLNNQSVEASSDKHVMIPKVKNAESFKNEISHPPPTAPSAAQTGGLNPSSSTVSIPNVQKLDKTDASGQSNILKAPFELIKNFVSANISYPEIRSETHNSRLSQNDHAASNLAPIAHPTNKLPASKKTPAQDLLNIKETHITSTISNQITNLDNLPTTPNKNITAQSKSSPDKSSAVHPAIKTHTSAKNQSSDNSSDLLKFAIPDPPPNYVKRNLQKRNSLDGIDHNKSNIVLTEDNFLKTIGQDIGKKAIVIYGNRYEGKSTLLSQIATKLTTIKKERKVLYMKFEDLRKQIKNDGAPNPNSTKATISQLLETRADGKIEYITDIFLDELPFFTSNEIFAGTSLEIQVLKIFTSRSPSIRLWITTDRINLKNIRDVISTKCYRIEPLVYASQMELVVSYWKSKSPNSNSDMNQFAGKCITQHKSNIDYNTEVSLQCLLIAIANLETVHSYFDYNNATIILAQNCSLKKFHPFFMDAVKELSFDELKLIFDLNLNYDYKEDDGGKSLFLCVNSVPKIKLLIERGASLNYINKENQNLLHYTTKWGSLDVLKYLLKLKKFDVNSIDKHGKTPLDYAVNALVVSLRDERVKLLCDYGATVSI